MLAEPFTALFVASTVALVVVLANVFQKEIAHVFAKHIPGVPSDFNGTKAGKDFSNPFEDIIHGHLGQRMILAVDPFPPPPGDDSPFPWPAISTSSVVLSRSTTSMSSTVSTSISSRISPTPTASSSQSETPSPLADPTNLIPHSPGLDEYHLYTGNGTIAAGWPHKADWMSFSDMFSTNIPLIISSCRLFHVTPNTLDEILSIHRAILTISTATNTDARFILAIILQESNGCVRVPTSFYSLRNPGLMQSHNGPATCNEDATPIYPCPYATIEEMIREGTAGTFEGRGMGLVMALREGTKGGKVDDVGRYYRAARIYNSGSIDPSGDLGKGVATHCYASDIANRLRGWSLADDGCVEGADSVIGGQEQPEGRMVRVGLMGVGFRRDG